MVEKTLRAQEIAEKNRPVAQNASTKEKLL